MVCQSIQGEFGMKSTEVAPKVVHLQMSENKVG